MSEQDIGRVRVEAHEAQCYSIRQHFYWAYIFVRHGAGETDAGNPRGWVHVSVLSDFGHFGYCWSHIGSRPWWRFLGEISFDYAMNKMLGRQFDVPLDIDAARDKLRAHVIDQRKTDCMSKKDARDLWDAAAICDSGVRFLEDLDAYSNGAMYRHELWDMRWTQPNPQAVGFWKHIWPHFITAITPCDSDRSPESEDADAASSETRARAEGIAQEVSHD